jgi:hypothetical protein
MGLGDFYAWGFDPISALGISALGPPRAPALSELFPPQSSADPDLDAASPLTKALAAPFPDAPRLTLADFLRSQQPYVDSFNAIVNDPASRGDQGFDPPTDVKQGDLSAASLPRFASLSDLAGWPSGDLNPRRQRFHLRMPLASDPTGN